MKIKDQLHEVIRHIQYTDKEFAAALKKWAQYICTCVFKVAKALQSDEEDVLQDLLLELTRSNLEYKRQFYRYNKHLYEIDHYDGSVVHLASNPFNKQFKHDIWVNCDSIKFVKKSSLISYIYRRTQQFQVDCINRCFTQQNGYKTSCEEKMVIVSSESNRVIKRKKVKKVVKVVDTVSSEKRLIADEVRTIGDTLKSKEPDPLFRYEELRITQEATKLSESAQKVLGELMTNPYVTERALARLVGLSRRKVRVAKAEIDRQLVSRRSLPIKDRYYFDGVDFNRLDSGISHTLLSLPSGRKILADTDDVVVRPSGIRPVYVNADQVR